MARIIGPQNPTLNTSEQLIFDSLQQLPGYYAVFTHDIIPGKYLPATSAYRFFLILHPLRGMLIIGTVDFKSQQFNDNKWNTEAPDKILKEFKQKLIKDISCDTKICLWYPMADIQSNTLPAVFAPTDGVLDSSNLLNTEHRIQELLSGVENNEAKYNRKQLCFTRWEKTINLLYPANNIDNEISNAVSNFFDTQSKITDNLKEENRIIFYGEDSAGRKQLLERLAKKYQPILVSRTQPPINIHYQNDFADINGGTVVVWNGEDYSAAEMPFEKNNRFYAFYNRQPDTVSADASFGRVSLAVPLLCSELIADTVRSLNTSANTVMLWKWYEKKAKKPYLHIIETDSLQKKEAVCCRIEEILWKFRINSPENIAVITLDGDDLFDSSEYLYKPDTQTPEIRIPVIKESELDNRHFECVIISGAAPKHFDGKNTELQKAVSAGIRFVHILMPLSAPDEQAAADRLSENFHLTVYNNTEWLLSAIHKKVSKTGIIIDTKNKNKHQKEIKNAISKIQKEQVCEVYSLNYSRQKNKSCSSRDCDELTVTPLITKKDKTAYKNTPKSVIITDFTALTITRPAFRKRLFKILTVPVNKLYIIASMKENEELPAFITEHFPAENTQ